MIKMTLSKVLGLNKVTVNANQNFLPQDIQIFTSGKLKIRFMANQQGTFMIVINGVAAALPNSQNLSANAWYDFEMNVYVTGTETTTINNVPVTRPKPVSINFQFSPSSSSVTSVTVTMIVVLETP